MCVGVGHQGSAWDGPLCAALHQPGPGGTLPFVGHLLWLGLLLWAFGVGTKCCSPLDLGWVIWWESLQGQASSREV